MKNDLSHSRENAVDLHVWVQIHNTADDCPERGGGGIGPVKNMSL